MIRRTLARQAEESHIDSKRSKSFDNLLSVSSDELEGGVAVDSGLLKGRAGGGDREAIGLVLVI